VVTIVAHDLAGAGGMERQLTSLVTRLLDHGVPVLVVSRTFGLPPHPLLAWRRVPGPARPFALGYPCFALAASVRLLRRPAGPLHATGAIVLNRADLCTVHYVHAGGFDQSGRTQRTTLPYRLNAAAVGMMSRTAERVIYGSPRLSGALVGVSAQIARELTRAYPGRTGEVHVIPNGVDPGRFRPDAGLRRRVRRSLGLGDETPVAVFVGSEWRGKGAHIALEAVALAPGWHLLLVGRGDRRELRALADEAGAGDRLHLTGESTTPERFYAAADAFVLPSAYESFSLVAFEAAAAGLPVIATRVGAIAEIVDRGGGLFADRSAAAFAEALRTVSQDREAATEMGRRARAAAMRFGWDTVAERYLALYSAAAGEEAPAR
jgi:UDP-glucose:(heptosyl)LPS alpha-1,3-glucosyltransferase